MAEWFAVNDSLIIDLDKAQGFERQGDKKVRIYITLGDAQYFDVDNLAFDTIQAILKMRKKEGALQEFRPITRQPEQRKIPSWMPVP